MGTVALAKPEVKNLESQLEVLKQKALTMVVNDKESSRLAKLVQRDVRDYMKDVHAKLDPFVESAKRNLQEARDLLNQWIVPAETVDAAVGQLVKDYERREYEAAAEETRQKNEAIRIAAAAAAKKAREEAETKAAQERKDREKEIADARRAGELNKKETERLKKEAAERERLAKEQAERTAIEQAKNVPTVTVQPDIAKVAGVPSRRNWSWEVVDESKIPEKYWILAEMDISAEVRSRKEKTDIPGIRVFQE